MDLVPVMKKNLAESERQSVGTSGRNEGSALQRSNAPSLFTVPTERQQQIGVTYATIQKHLLSLTIRAVGTVAYDKQRHWDYVSRVDGYAQKLFIFSRGELVEKDAPLLTIYSPDLLTTQNEFVDVLRTRDSATNGDKVVLEGMQ